MNDILKNKGTATVLEAKEIIQLSFRLDNLLQGHTSVQYCIVRNWKNQDFYRDPSDGKLHQYDPFPRISSPLLTLQKKLSHPDYQYHIQGQERFFIYLLLNAIKLLNTINDYKLKEVSLTDVEEPVSLDKRLQVFVWYVVHLWKKKSSRLSHQTVNDLHNEIFRLNILVQYSLLTSFHELEQPSSSTAHILHLKTFLIESARNHGLKVSHDQYITLTIAGRQVFPA